MKLHTSMTSPFGRKCRMVILALGLDDRIQVVEADNKSPEFLKLNPLSKVPALELDDERVLINSPVVSAFIASQGDTDILYPTDDTEKWTALNQEALADGMTDAGVLMFVESFRSEKRQSLGWIEKQRGKVNAALDVFESQATTYGATVHIGMLALAAGLGWLDMRGVLGDWRQNRPQLSAWFDEFSKHDFCQKTS